MHYVLIEYKNALHDMQIDNENKKIIITIKTIKLCDKTKRSYETNLPKGEQKI